MAKVRLGVPVVVEVLALVWAAFSFLSDAADAGPNASKLWKLMADPPNNLPWIIAFIAGAAIVWALRNPRLDGDSDPPPVPTRGPRISAGGDIGSVRLRNVRDTADREFLRSDGKISRLDVDGLDFSGGDGGKEK